MKIPCAVIEDLLPLYHDGICNEGCRKYVDEHLAACDECKVTLGKLGNTAFDSYLENEREEIVSHHAKTIKRTSFLVGIAFASFLSVPLLITLLVNLTTHHSLDWFFIVLTSLMMFASLTVVPLVLVKNKGIWTMLSFTASLALLLITCAVYTGGTWQGYGRPALIITSASLSLPWGLFLIIRYIKANKLVVSGLCVMLIGLFFSMIESIIYWVIEGVFRIQFMRADLSIWNDNNIDPNVFLICFLSGCVIGGLLILAGLLKKVIAQKALSE